MVNVIRNCSLVSAVWATLVFAAMVSLVLLVSCVDTQLLSRLTELFKYAGATDVVLAVGGTGLFLPVK